MIEECDTLIVFHGNSPANDEAVLTAEQLTGLGMGGDAVIGGRVLPGVRGGSARVHLGGLHSSRLSPVI